MKKIFATFCCLFTAFQGFAVEPEPKSDQELVESLLYLNWVGGGTYQLPKSQALLSFPTGHAALLMDGVKQFLSTCIEIVRRSHYLENLVEEVLSEEDLLNLNSNDEEIAQESILKINATLEGQNIIKLFGTTEAILLPSYDFFRAICFQYFPEEHVSLDNWDQMDPEQLLDALQKKNKDIVGWVLVPTLDVSTHTISLAFREKDPEDLIDPEDLDDEHIELVVFQLGRSGFEKISSTLEPTSPETEVEECLAMLDFMQQAFIFSPGSCYEDFVPGCAETSSAIADVLVRESSSQVF